ncbi:MAG: VOC family protein [Actinobacteria bacterium]|nr:VOC family protein [Actinomycetota bacterium]
MPKRLLSPLSHVELLTPDLEKSVEYVDQILGLDIVREEGDSVYLRCWGDYYLYSLVLTAAAEPGLGHMAWRAEGPEQLAEVVSRIEASGTQGEWVDGAVGHGRAFRFTGPGQHRQEIFWEVERAEVPAAEKSTYPERPQRNHRRGLAVRILDHVTVTAPDVRGFAGWTGENMGLRTMAAVEPEPGAPWVFAVMTNNEKAHDLGCIQDFEGQSGRLHHVAFWVETNHDLTEGAKFILEHGHEVDTGPGQHGIGEQNYLYFRDPVGLRYELNSGGYRNYVPDWETVIWSPEQGSNNAYRTEIGMAAVSMVNIPPGISTQSAGVVGTSDDSAEAALVRS